MAKLGKDELGRSEIEKLTSPTDNEIALQQAMFNGPLSDWARIRREEFGEEVSTRQLFIANKKGHPHQVAWLSRAGLDFDSGKIYHFYHLACDCMPNAEKHKDPELMFSCEALTTALAERARAVGNEYGLPDLLDMLTKDNNLNTLTESGQQVAVSTIGYIMERGLLHPEEWLANYINGRHEISTLSLILGREASEVSEFAAILEDEGVVKFDGISIKPNLDLLGEDQSL